MKRVFSIRVSSVFFLLILGISVLLLAQHPFAAQARGRSWQQYIYNDPVHPTDSRPYFVYTPPNYHVGMVVPLIVMLHGCEQTAADFAAGTQMNKLADQHSFIVVYPQEITSVNAARCWNWYDPANQVRGSGEAASIAGIVEVIEQDTIHWSIDAHRVYVAGLSAGAALSVILGATYPDMFAAIGVHSGVEYEAATNPVSGENVLLRGGPDPVQQGQAAFAAMGSFARVVPTIVFHGIDDAITNPLNGDQVVQQWMQTDMLASHGAYAATFSSPTGTTTGQVANGHAYTVNAWDDSNGNEVQEYWKVDSMGHAWSGGSYSGSYTDPLGPDASAAMYAFFMNHPM
jgi:poly(hydroxyalkanoate) depolymerase family esterase